MAKKKKKRKDVQKQCAVFTYDLFPYMVIYDVLEIQDDGSIIFEKGYALSANSLVAIFPRKKKKDIKNMLDHIERQYDIAQEDARNTLLHQLAEHFPALQKECEKHYAKN